ncbi:MAG: metallophosphoesterase [Halobacterium sp.]
MSERFLVMGDNHGDTESLRRVLDDLDDRDERVDLAVHVGDFTRAMRHDREVGVEQLRAVEPLLERVDDRADHGLVWVWGNQDYFGDLDYDLDAGTEIPQGGAVAVGGQQFTNDPAQVGADDVLVTHMETWRLADDFQGKAHFCGNTHLGRRLDRRLNAAFLQATPQGEDGKRFGGYFVVEFDDDGGFDVEMRSIGGLRRVECEVHRERGVQFLPVDQECMFCWQDEVLLREQAASAFYGVTRDGSETAAVDAVVEYAVSRWDDPPEGFREDFEAYLADVDDDRYAPLTRTEDGRLAVAENSYAY